jgi:hypothetical protein
MHTPDFFLVCGEKGRVCLIRRCTPTVSNGIEYRAPDVQAGSVDKGNSVPVSRSLPSQYEQITFSRIWPQFENEENAD